MSQYALIFIAVTFTWLMGLMGYVRARHCVCTGTSTGSCVTTSVDAFTPTLGFATQVVSVDRIDRSSP